MLYLVKKNSTYLILTFLFIFYPLLIAIVLILLLVPEQDFALDKLTHFAAFSFLTFFTFFFLSYQEKFWFIKKHRVFFSILVVTLVGGTIELIQLTMPGRSTSLFDMGANLVGAFYTIYLIKHLPKSIRKYKKYSI